MEIISKIFFINLLSLAGVAFLDRKVLGGVIENNRILCNVATVWVVLTVFSIPLWIHALITNILP